VTTYEGVAIENQVLGSFALPHHRAVGGNCGLGVWVHAFSMPSRSLLLFIVIAFASAFRIDYIFRMPRGPQTRPRAARGRRERPTEIWAESRSKWVRSRTVRVSCPRADSLAFALPSAFSSACRAFPSKDGLISGAKVRCTSSVTSDSMALRFRPGNIASKMGLGVHEFSGNGTLPPGASCEFIGEQRTAVTWPCSIGVSNVGHSISNRFGLIQEVDMFGAQLFVVLAFQRCR